MNGVAVEQQFFGERGLAGIRVRDDRKSAARVDCSRKRGWCGQSCHGYKKLTATRFSAMAVPKL